MERARMPTARQIMSEEFVRMTQDVPVARAIEILLERDASCALVVDDANHLLGLLSEYDCLRAVASGEYLADDFDSVETVADIMTTEMHHVSPALDLYGIVHELVTRRVRQLPVLDGDRLVGLVTRRDAVRAVERMHTQQTKQYPDYPKNRTPIT